VDQINVTTEHPYHKCVKTQSVHWLMDMNLFIS